MNSQEELVEIVKKASETRDDRLFLACAEAFKIAEQHGVELLDVARVCNKNKIKIVACQLGCFK